MELPNTGISFSVTGLTCSCKIKKNTLPQHYGLIEAEADLSKAFSLFTSVNFLERSMFKTWFTKHNATHRDVNTSYQCHSCPKKFSRPGWLKFYMYANILVTFGRFLLSVVKHRNVQLQFLVLKYLTSISFGPPSLLSYLRSDTSPPEVRQGHGDRR